MEKDGACKMERQNKKCSCARKGGRRKNNSRTAKEEEMKLAGPLAKEELPAQGCSRRNDKREESARKKKLDYETTLWEMDCMKIRKGRLRRGLSGEC